MKYLLILLSIIVAILAYTTYHQDYFAKQEKKLLNSQIEALQKVNDSLSDGKREHIKEVVKFKQITKVLTIDKGYSQRQVDSLLDIFQPTIIDTVQFNNCKAVVVAQTKEIVLDNKLITAKDSIIANTEFALGDAESMLRNKEVQLSDKSNIIAIQSKQIKQGKNKGFVSKLVVVGEAVVIGFLALKTIK